MRGRDGGTGPAFLGLGSRLGSARGRSPRRRGGGGGGGGGLAIYTPAGQPVTVGFQSFQEAEWVWGTVRGHGPPLDFPSPGCAPFRTGRAAPGSGPSCPRSSLRKQIQASRGLLELCVCPGSREGFRGPEALRGSPPPLLAAIQDAELSLGPTVGGGAEGSGSPPLPQLRFRLGDSLYRPRAERRPPPPPLIPWACFPGRKPGTAPRPRSEPGGGREAGAETEKATPKATCREQ